MVYIFVLFGSFLGICVILGARVALKNRNVRKFVHSVCRRADRARERGISMRETSVEKPEKNLRKTAIELQQMRVNLRQAEKAMARQQYDEAEKFLIQALTVVPNAYEAKAELGKLYLLTDRDHKAEAMYRELILERGDVSFHANLGLACFRQGKYRESCIAYEEALAQDPKNPERQAALGRACVSAGKFREAAPLLERASERLARDTVLIELLGDCYARLGLREQAEETYERLHKIVPYDEGVKEKLGALRAA